MKTTRNETIWNDLSSLEEIFQIGNTIGKEMKSWCRKEKSIDASQPSIDDYEDTLEKYDELYQGKLSFLQEILSSAQNEAILARIRELYSAFEKEEKVGICGNVASSLLTKQGDAYTLNHQEALGEDYFVKHFLHSIVDALENKEDNAFLRGVVQGYYGEPLSNTVCQQIQFILLLNYFDCIVINQDQDEEDLREIAIEMNLILGSVNLFADEDILENPLYYLSDVANLGQQYLPKTGGWHCFDKDTGIMKKGFVELCGDYIGRNEQPKTVYYDQDGKMVYGQQFLDGYWYYFDEIYGTMKKGFLKIPYQDKTVYYNQQGRMLYGDQVILGKKYHLDEVTGALQEKELDQTLVTIGVPVYNAEKYLRRCIDSILNQTYTNLEILLIDDGSSDGSLAICQEYEKKDSRIKVHHKENEGAWSARNYGIDIASGSYLGFIDSDDEVLPTYIETLVRNLEEHDADISICYFWWIDEGEATHDGVNFDIELFEDPYRMMRFEYGLQVDVTCRLVRKSIYGDIRYPAYRDHEDAMLANHLLPKAKKIVYTHERLYKYYRHNESLSDLKNTSIPFLENAYNCVEERVIMLDELGYEEERNTWLNLTFSWFIMNGYEAGKQQNLPEIMELYQNRFRKWAKRFPDEFYDDVYERMEISKEEIVG